ncbi:MAG: hypothetical protein P8M02_07905 [Flavobacteriaceae bacterium]|nr:hypothetical protein [Flavobacteriaceae bacterium]
MHDNSFYNWPNFSDEEIKTNSEIICGILEDFIRIQDWFESYNEFINHDNPEKNYVNQVEGKLNGINLILKIGRIEKEEHKEFLENSIYSLTSSMPRTMDAKKRAIQICESLKKDILEMAKNL